MLGGTGWTVQSPTPTFPEEAMVILELSERVSIPCSKIRLVNLEQILLIVCASVSPVKLATGLVVLGADCD